VSFCNIAFDRNLACRLATRATFPARATLARSTGTLRTARSGIFATAGDKEKGYKNEYNKLFHAI
jgi:hypothetical protein